MWNEALLGLITYSAFSLLDGFVYDLDTVIVTQNWNAPPKLAELIISNEITPSKN